MFRNTLRIFMFLCLSIHGLVFGQDLDSLLEMSAFTPESDLQKVLNKNVAVASQKAMTTRETPGIISLITAEDIENSGARDLIDILRMVPGFDVLQDLQFVMGIGFRGNWANEGKVLVMLDGHPMNELLYQTVALGNRFPIDAIDRIEIIRGPGSAIYGGSAEYGVINIITKAASSLNGVATFVTTGAHAHSIGRMNAGAMVAKRDKTFSWDLAIFKGSGIVSDRPFQDLYQEDDVQDLAKISHADPTNIKVGIQYKDFSFRSMYDYYNTGDPVSMVSNKSGYIDAKYDFKVNNKLTLTPSIQYITQIPWAIDTLGDDDGFHHFYRAQANRFLSQLNGNYTPNRKLNIVAGALYFSDKGIDLLEEENFIDGNEFVMHNVAFYTQMLYQHRLFNATVGARYERNNRFGSAFVPRIALTKKIENFHFKVLYSQSFRSPSIENISASESGVLRPEKSSVAEFEFGYQFTPAMLLSLNAFSLATKDVIIYFVSNGGAEEWYENFSKSGSNGFELIYSLRQKNWYAMVTYSYSEAISSNTVDTYVVPQSTKQYAGFPLHKITASNTVKLSPKLSFNTSIIFAGKRYAYTSYETIDLGGGEYEFTPVVNKLPDYLLFNCFFNFKEIVSGFSAGVGVYDLFNAHPAIPQPYNGEYAPIPGRSREFVLKLNYQLNFKKVQR